MVVLGINAFHPDSSGALILDGKLTAAVPEERLGRRVKHVAGFPRKAVEAALKMGGCSIRDIDYVAFGHNNNANLLAKAKHVLANPVRSAISVALHARRRGQLSGLREIMADACGVRVDDCRFNVVSVEHHLAHIASSYFASRCDEAAGFSYDGSGDFVSGMFAQCRGNEIKVLGRVFVPHSLGFLYTAICQFIGFERFGEEYKVMGLAAYGRPKHADLMREIAMPYKRGQYRLNMKFFRPPQKTFDECMNERGEIILPPLYSAELERRLGPPRQRSEPIGQREMDLARSCQDHFEELVLHSVRTLHNVAPSQNLVTAGGCALNGVCNARILRETPFSNSYIQCAASDDGTAVGAALYLWNCILKGERSPPIEHAYFGPEHSEKTMREGLEKAQIPFVRLERPELLARTVSHLAVGHVIGWYQGRSEWGPRALGNRSILAHPGWPGMKDLINQKIKRREAFRPFAPSILAEAVSDYFEQNIESPFMMHVVKIKPEKRAELAAVCHADHTGRLHTVRRDQNELYYDLIKAFSRRTGTPVLLNTSFNENEPIVDTPEQAIACFQRTDIDALVLGPFIIAKPGKELS